MFKYPLILFFIAFSLIASPKVEYQKLSNKYHKFFKERGKTRDQWLKLIKQFSSHGDKYKDKEIASKSYYTAGNLYYKLYQTSKKKGDINKAIGYFNTVCTKYSKTSLCDDACYVLYTFYFRYMKDHENSKKYALYIINNYPKSDSYKKAENFLKTYYPKVLKQQKNSKKPLSTINHKKFSLKIFKKKIIAEIKGKTIEKAKVGSVIVDNELLKIFIDIPDEKFYGLKAVKVDSDIISKVRFGQYQPKIARLVFDFKKEGKFKVLDRGKTLVIELKLAPEKKESIDIVETVEPEKKVIEKKEIKKVENKIDKKEESSKNKNGGIKSVVIKKGKKDRKKIIVIDPGHGGDDPGAVSPDKKLQEKDIVLDVALKLEKILKKNKKYKIILTRRGDKTLSLDDRTDIANKNKGDLFISIHVNAIPSGKFYGIETFYLNIAANNYSKRLEAVENAEHQKKITDLQFILADLLKKANTKDSVELANYMQSSLIFNLRRKYKNIRDLGVKNAMFYVLLDTKMPSVLVELGFITNKMERKRLKNKKYREYLAKSLAKGVNNYFSKKTVLKKGKK